MNNAFANQGSNPGIINDIALRRCTDTTHVIKFSASIGLATWTLAELDLRAARVARHLKLLGVQRGDRVGIMAHNRIEWVLLDLAVIKIGAITAGFETGRFSSTQIVSAYGLKVLFTEEEGVRDAVRDIAEVLDRSEDTSFDHGWGALHDGYDAADILAIKFTSGSTGVPKGLEATVASVEGSLAAVQDMFGHGHGDNLLVFLRLALLQQRYWIYSAFAHGHDVTISDFDSVMEAAPIAAPTVVMGVPGFYEAVRARLHSEKLSSDAIARGRAIQAALGGRIRYLWTGSAPCSRAILDFFNDAGVPLYEGYGLNETCIIAKNHPGAFRPGSVGRLLPGKSIRFDREGILIVGSQHPVNCRYTWCGDGVNERTFLPTGEVKTWDVGHVDEDGFLYIHGRVDDILTLSNGRNVLVRLVEEQLREHKDVHECVLFGNGQSFLTAIVSPRHNEIDTNDLAHRVQVMNSTFQAEQRIHALVIADQKFSVENGMLTSQFKPKRKEIYSRHANALSQIYGNSNPVAFSGNPIVRVVRTHAI